MRTNKPEQKLIISVNFQQQRKTNKKIQLQDTLEFSFAVYIAMLS
jgi:hypothetical protein